jgi:hypothetical protein
MFALRNASGSFPVVYFILSSRLCRVDLSGVTFDRGDFQAGRTMHPPDNFATRAFVMICAVAVLFLMWVFGNLLAEPKRRNRRKR